MEQVYDRTQQFEEADSENSLGGAPSEDLNVEIKIGKKELEGLRQNEIVENGFAKDNITKLCSLFNDEGLLSEQVLMEVSSEEAQKYVEDEVLGNLQQIFGAAEAASYAKQTLQAPNPDQVVGTNIRDKIKRDGSARIWGMGPSELDGLTVSSQMIDRLKNIKLGNSEHGTSVAWTNETAGGKRVLHLMDAQGRELQLVLDPKGSVMSADVIVSNGRNLDIDGESRTANSAESYLVGLDAYKALSAGRYLKESVNSAPGVTAGEMARDTTESGQDTQTDSGASPATSTSVFEQPSSAVVEKQEKKSPYMQEFADYYVSLEERSRQELPDLGFDRNPEQVKRDFLRRGNSFFVFKNGGENGDLTNARDVWQNPEMSLSSNEVKRVLSDAYSVKNMDNPRYDRLRVFSEVAARIDEHSIRTALVASAERGAGTYPSSRSVYETQVLGKLKAELKAAVLEVNPGLINIPASQLEAMLDSNLKDLVGFSVNIQNWSEPKV